MFYYKVLPFIHLCKSPSIGKQWHASESIRSTHLNKETKPHSPQMELFPPKWEVFCDHLYMETRNHCVYVHTNNCEIIGERYNH